MNPNPAFPGFTLLPNSDRARYAMLCLRIISGISLVYAVFTFSLLASVENKGYRTPAAQLISTALMLISIIPWILCIVFFLLWMSRAYANLHRIGGQQLQFNSGWAAASWFIPLGNLVLPLFVVLEIWKYTQSFYQATFFPKKKPGPVYLWWGLLLAAIFFSFVSGVAMGMEFIAGGFFFVMVAHLCFALAAVYAVKIIRDISKMEADLLRRAEDYQRMALSEAAHAMNHPYYQNNHLFQPPTPPASEEFLSGPFVENAERASFVKIALWLLLPFVCLFAFLRMYVLTEIGEMNFMEVIIAARHWTTIFQPLAWIVAATVIAAFMLWMSRSYQNLHHLKTPRLSFGPGMAAGGWLIPLANFYLPYAVLSDIARETAAHLQAVPGEQPVTRKVPVTLTWLLLLVGLGLSLLGKLMTMPTSFLLYGDVFTGSVASLAGLFCLAGAILSAIRMVGVIDEMERQLFVRVESRVNQEEAETGTLPEESGEGQ